MVMCVCRSVAEAGTHDAIVSGAGGLHPGELCGRSVLYSIRQPSINTFASNNVSNTSRLRSSSRRLPLKLSMYPFSQGLPGLMYSVLTPTLASHPAPLGR